MGNKKAKKTAKDLLYIISCAIDNIAIDKAKIDTIDIEAVFELASKHMLRTAVAISLELSGVKNELTATAIVAGVRRTVIFEKSWSIISSEFEKEGIWYLPLKGMVIKNYYPKVAMREFSDYDILFDKSMACNVRTIMESLGFTTKSFGINNDDVYYKPPVLNFEMHRELIHPKHGDLFYEYYITIKKRLLHDSSNKCKCHLSNEDFYIFFLVHEYKHFIGSGTGLRSLVDTYVLNKYYGDTLDKEYLSRELKKLGIYEFERNNRILAEKLFTGQELDEREKELFKRYLYSEAYGNFKTRIANQGVDGSVISKIRYALKRMTLPESLLREKYPLFYKYKILRSFLYVYRLIRKAKKSPQALKSEICELKHFK